MGPAWPRNGERMDKDAPTPPEPIEPADTTEDDPSWGGEGGGGQYRGGPTAQGTPPNAPSKPSPGSRPVR
jgi:hypothetical protein